MLVSFSIFHWLIWVKSSLSSAMFGYGGPPCEISVKLQKIEGRKAATMKDRNGQSYKAPVFMVS